MDAPPTGRSFQIGQSEYRQLCKNFNKKDRHMPTSLEPIHIDM